MAYAISTLLNAAALPRAPEHDITGRIYSNLITVMAARDERLSDLLMIDQLEDTPHKSRMEQLERSLRSRIDELFGASGYGELAERAFAMDRHALTLCTRAIVENFLEEDILKKDTLSARFDRYIDDNDISHGSIEEIHIKENLKRAFHEYETLHNLKIAGPVFDFPITDIDAAEIEEQMDLIYTDCVHRGLHWQSIRKHGPSSLDF